MSNIKIIKYTWIIIGIIQIYICFNMYWIYSSGQLFLFIEPQYVAIKNLIMGIISIIIGFKFDKKNKIGLWCILLITLLIPTVKIGINIYELIKYDETSFYIWASLDYLLFILIYFTYKRFELEVSFWKTIFNNIKTLVLGSLSTLGLIILLNEILSYETFTFLH
ncbi:hypothetical protein SAMN05444274_1279 [Mariniphaga anaerophila]|uniref:Uncharacterized protein n=1 Tax=Mariniphaga anaerophila TaxID=1484053 RepID=A0A1M5GN44_9BACT|nr:hypothetical protein SAMN05444274_1279 [Mariniphaga anaerophila]